MWVWSIIVGVISQMWVWLVIVGTPRLAASSVILTEAEHSGEECNFTSILHSLSFEMLP